MIFLREFNIAFSVLVSTAERQSSKIKIFGSKTLKLAVLLQLLILLDSLVVMIMSSAPIEQQIFGRTGLY
jgi:hypothetical protein